MRSYDFAKMTPQLQKYNLRFWLFNRIRDRDITPHDAMRIDDDIIKAYNDTHNLLEVARKYGYLHD